MKNDSGRSLINNIYFDKLKLEYPKIVREMQ